MVTTPSIKIHWKIPRLEPEELSGYQDIITGASALASRIFT